MDSCTWNLGICVGEVGITLWLSWNDVHDIADDVLKCTNMKVRRGGGRQPLMQAQMWMPALFRRGWKSLDNNMS